MKYTLYDVTIPVFIRSLETLRKIVKKAKKHAAGKKGGMGALLNARLAPDMYNLIQQVQYAYFMALETAVNLSGRPMPKNFKYKEKTAADLDREMKRATAFLKTIPRGGYGASKKGVQTFLDPKKKFRAGFYATMLALPNFFFHVTTAYDILRHKGVPLTKDDYLGL